MQGTNIKVNNGMNLNKTAYRSISVKLQVATGSHDVSVIAGSHVVAVNRLTCVSLAVRDVTHTQTVFGCKRGISGRRCRLLRELTPTSVRLIEPSLQIYRIQGVPGGMCQTSGECSLS